jgi:hypothetical protein
MRFGLHLVCIGVYISVYMYIWMCAYQYQFGFVTFIFKSFCTDRVISAETFYKYFDNY